MKIIILVHHLGRLSGRMQTPGNLWQENASVNRLLEELPSTTQLPDAISNCQAAISKIVQIARHSPLELQQYEVV